VAALPARQPRLPASRARGTGAPPLIARLRTPAAATAAAVLLALLLAGWGGVHTVPADGVLDTVQAALRACVAAVLLFLVCGFGVARLLVPEHARRYELLWALGAGACAVALVMTVLGFAYVPFKVSLALTIAGGLALSAFALRRSGGARPPLRPAGWPLFIGVLLTAVALVPYFSVGFPTVTGSGSDAFHAVGTAEFLQHNHPAAVNEDGPLDEMPIRWGSKQPIYYVLGAIATLSGLEPYETLTPAAAVVFALAAIGIFLLARELLGATVWAAVLAMGITGLNAMVLRTVLNPYYNQTWGYFAFLFSLVAGWWAVRERHRGALVLFVLFMLVCAFAYPLALPIPGLAVAIFFALDARERKRRGEPTGLPSVRPLWRGGRGLVWMLPVALLLAIPAGAAAQKAWDAAELLVDPNSSLEAWAGDLLGFIPAYKFFGLATGTLWWLAVAAMVVLAAWLLAKLPRPLGWGIAIVLAAFLLAGAWFRQRDFGWYFEFKTLAFAAPVLVACAVVALSRLGRAGVVVLIALVISAELAARPEVRNTGHQLDEQQLELREWSRALPPDASVRLDTWPPNQLWGSYMLARQPLCSQRPLLDTDYPRVAVSRKADYILVDELGTRVYGGDPPDAAGPALRANSRFRLYRMKPSVAGRDNCSRRLIYDSR
jgi:hypothetical protein